MAGSANEPCVWAIVLNYNGAEVLVDCLLSLRKQDYPNLHRLVVDNASADGSEAIAEEMEDIELIRNDRNLFFSAGKFSHHPPAGILW